MLDRAIAGLKTTGRTGVAGRAGQRRTACATSTPCSVTLQARARAAAGQVLNRIDSETGARSTT